MTLAEKKKICIHSDGYGRCDILSDDETIEYCPDHLCSYEDRVEYERVVHGHWERRNGAAWCSACKRHMNPGLYGYQRCGLCGAHMDEGVF